MAVEINDLVNKLNDLVIVLKDSRKTPGTSGGGGQTESVTDKNIKLLITALGKVALKLDGTARTKKEEEQALKRFSLSVDRTTEAHEKYFKRIEEERKVREEAAKRARMSADELAKYNKQQLEEKKKRDAEEAMKSKKAYAEQLKTTSASQDLWESYQNLGSATDILKNSFFKFAGDSMIAQSGMRLFAATVEGTIKAITQYTKSIYEGERGALVTAKAFSTLTKTITEVTSVLGPMITIIGLFAPASKAIKGALIFFGAATTAASALANTFADLNEVSAKQFDALFKSFQELSTVGIVAADGMDGVFRLAQELNLTTAEYEKLNKLLVENSKNFGLMGFTLFQGAEQFAQVAGNILDLSGQEFRLMGMHDDEIRESILAFSTMLSKSGQIQIKNTGDLVAESKKYIHELDLAAKLTGTQRKQQQEALAFAQADARFRAAEFRATQSGDSARLAELQTMRQASALAHAMGDIEGATGLLHIGAGRGILQSEQAVKAEMAYGGSQLLGKPGISQVQILQHLAQYAGYSMEMMGDLNEIIGSGSPLQTDITKMMDIILRNQMIQSQARGIQDPEERARFIEEEMKKFTLVSNDNTSKMVASINNQQQTVLNLDGIMKKFGDKFSTAVKMHEDATEVFRKATDEFAKKVGVPGTPSTPGTPGSSGAGSARPQSPNRPSPATPPTVASPSIPSAPSGPAHTSATLPPGTSIPGIIIHSPQKQSGKVRPAPQSSGLSGEILVNELLNFTAGSGGPSSLNMLNEGLLDSLVLAANDLFNTTGKKINITSSYRSSEEQADLYAKRVKTLANGIGILPNGLPVAPPGRSAHEKGNAIDIGNYNDSDVVKYLNMYGLIQNVRGDAPHFVKAANGALIQPTPGGTLVQAGEAGKAEAVVPMPDGRTIPVSLTNANEQQAKLSYHFETMSNKFDTIIDLLSSGNRIQDNIARNFV